jgi:DNA-binding NarL/FixJ family response regulator
MIDIILADDHKVVRKGIQALLTTESDFNIVGEVEDGPGAVDLVERIKPDILVLDLMMPGMNGLDVLRVLNDRGSKTGIVILSMHNSEAYISKALALGAKGYVLKEATAEELVTAIREVRAGRLYLCAGIPRNILNQFQTESRNEDRADELFHKLTPREKEIILLTGRGLRNKEIAEKMCLSVRTIETHRANLMEKLNLNSHSQLVHFALKTGLIRTDPQR